MNYEKDKNILSPVPFATIDAYPSSRLSGEPLLYPGARPDTSFLLSGKDLYELSAENVNGTLSFAIESSDDKQSSLDDYLMANNAESMNGRIPILAYGANMNPASLYAKFDDIGRGDAHIVPTLFGQLKDHDVVWSGGPGVNGNFVANLYTGEETKGTEITVGVNFLTKEQLLAMHRTEIPYDLAEVPVTIAGVTINALVYSGIDNILIRNGRPVAVDAVEAQEGTRKLEGASTVELTEWMAQMPEVQTVLASEGAEDIRSASEYVESSLGLKSLKEKTARKLKVHSVFERAGLSKLFRLPVAESALQSWANPSAVQSYGEQLEGIHAKDVYTLPSSEVPHGSWSSHAKRSAMLSSISTHFIYMTGLEQIGRRLSRTEQNNLVINREATYNKAR